MCKLPPPDCPSPKLKLMNRHVVILVVSNVAIALTSAKQRHQSNKTRRFSAWGYLFAAYLVVEESSDP
jgi:hypothetical protein